LKQTIYALYKHIDIRYFKKGMSADDVLRESFPELYGDDDNSN